MFLSLSDFLTTLQWWGYFFIIGLIFFPLTSRLFSGFVDKGYPFAKIIGAVVLSYIVFVLGITHIASFTQMTISLVTIVCAICITFFLIKSPQTKGFSPKSGYLIFFEEIMFFTGLLFWAHIRAFQPDIFGLEKYMDFGFVNSILRSTYFPPRDMWYTPLPINYYYFGHLVTAVITKLSGIPSFISFNLMLATLFSFTYTLSFSLAGNMWSHFVSKDGHTKRYLFYFISAGLLGGFLVTLGGNVHTLYTFFTPYANDNPVPFWQLIFSPKTFPNAYWYPNATRFIYHTIHEFPSYSFVVSDLHGHVLDIPMVLTTIALLFAIIIKTNNANKRISNVKFQMSNFKSIIGNYWTLDIGYLILLGFSLACMYMTNAWDGMIYFLLSAIVIFWKTKQEKKNNLLFIIYSLLFIFGFFLLFSLPFSLFFNPGALVGGIGLICSPQFLMQVGRIGPFVFEPNHCMHSPLWQLGVLYGFFLFWLVSFAFILYKQRKLLASSDIFVAILSGMAIFLIIIPEFFYLRDIYTTYFRANTMFKLVYQAFILFSLATTYCLFRFGTFYTSHARALWRKILLLPYGVIGIALFGLVGMYAYFAVTAYYGNLSTYKGLNGITYLSKSYPSDALGITWLNSNVVGQPVILEAQGDSYTEYARVSANTGLPTVLGWPVHEWLWRGTYDIVSPRSSDIKTMYETTDRHLFTQLAKKYAVQYVFVGQLERTKYPGLDETKLQKVGKVVFHTDSTTIYQLIF